MFRSAASQVVPARTLSAKCSNCMARRWNTVVAYGSKDREAQLQWVSPENRSVLPSCCNMQAAAASHKVCSGSAPKFCDFGTAHCLLFFRKDVAQILDLAERAAERWEVSYTHFVSPPVAADALAAINQRADIKAVAWGGYPQAERCRVAIGKEEVMLTASDDPSTLDDAVAALDVRGNFIFDPAAHRDFLGAIIGTGIVRDRIGVSVPCSRIGGWQALQCC